MAADKFHPGTQIYDLDYFSGSQMFLYIGDVWIDEVTSLQYQHLQPKTPIYGYASQLFDDVASGHILVTGAFTINYKEQGYLWAALRRYKGIGLQAALGGNAAASKEELDKFLLETSKDTLRTSTGLDRRPVWGSQATKTQRLDVERITQGELTRGQAYEFYSDLAGFATVQGPGRDAKFADMMDVFEDVVWSKDVNNTKLKYMYRNPTDNIFDDFDMYVTFGNYSVPGANHTVSKLVGVHLTSRGKEVRIDGAPIQEIYEFIAQCEI